MTIIPRKLHADPNWLKLYEFQCKRGVRQSTSHHGDKSWNHGNEIITKLANIFLGYKWTSQYHCSHCKKKRSRSLFYCQRLQATAITELTAVKECMTDPTASACTDTYGSRFLAPPLNNPSFRVCVFAIHFQFQLQLTNRLGGKMWRHHMYHAYHRPWCCQRMFQG